MVSAIRGLLERAPPSLFGAYAGLMAFGTYFSIYAFRKAFAAAHFAGAAPVLTVEYKVALVIAQVLGYAVSKFIGVRVIAELPAHQRISGIVLQCLLAEAALVAFAIVPPPWNVLAMFADGLTLGMVWGMCFAFVEGRRQSDLIGAMLCASFVISSGVMKSVGTLVMAWHIASEWWMPAVTGVLFIPTLALSLFGLATLPPPDAQDIAERVERVPMGRSARRAFLGRFGPGLVALVALYVLLTALRDFRDNFAAEIWAEVGLGGKAELFSLTELPISVMVLCVLALLTLIRDNRRALVLNFALIALGAAMAAVSSALFMLHAIGPVAWMTILGGGLYLAYTPFNGMMFDRLVAASGSAGNAAFLIYIADTAGYGGSVTLLLLRNLPGFRLPWTQFLIDAGIGCGVLGLVLMAWAALYFRKAIVRP
ncbi:DUF5690 family protein [Novosphingobium nitrogenifigens]|uniref:DUF5690 family protein n=1 Tax=Novosphingobium nitrogenifigens TaxID=378548 RepID=UPI0002EF8786|nr:DUF5690 family protein [Novosphingobium nitrogenifigens]